MWRHINERKAVDGVVQVRIDAQRCQGHGRCVLIAPQVFELDQAGLSHVSTDEVSDIDLADVREAVISCPEQAISLSE